MGMSGSVLLCERLQQQIYGVLRSNGLRCIPVR
jgi:hypothetical protein